jgi:hypothetical protein
MTHCAQETRPGALYPRCCCCCCCCSWHWPLTDRALCSSSCVLSHSNPDPPPRPHCCPPHQSRPAAGGKSRTQKGASGSSSHMHHSKLCVLHDCLAAKSCCLLSVAGRTCSMPCTRRSMPVSRSGLRLFWPRSWPCDRLLIEQKGTGGQTAKRHTCCPQCLVEQLLNSRRGSCSVLHTARPAHASMCCSPGPAAEAPVQMRSSTTAAAAAADAQVGALGWLAGCLSLHTHCKG